MKRILFSAHARDQIAERHIFERSIHRCIEKPDATLIQSSGRIRAVMRIMRAKKPYVLVVVYEETRSSVFIITAFIASKIKKYL